MREWMVQPDLSEDSQQLETHRLADDDDPVVRVRFARSLQLLVKFLRGAATRDRPAEDLDHVERRHRNLCRRRRQMHTKAEDDVVVSHAADTTTA